MDQSKRRHSSEVTNFQISGTFSFATLMLCDLIMCVCYCSALDATAKVKTLQC